MIEARHLRGEMLQQTYVPGQATAGTADSFPVFQAIAACRIKAFGFVPATLITGAATNNFALQAINRGTANAGTTGVTSALTFASGTDAAKNVLTALTLSATESDLRMAAGEVLDLVRTINGTGLAMPDGLVIIRYQFGR